MKRLGMWAVVVLAVVLLAVAVAGQSAPSQNIRAGCSGYIWNNMEYMALVASAPHAKFPNRWRCIYEFAEAPAGVITPTPYPTGGGYPPSNGG